MQVSHDRLPGGHYLDTVPLDQRPGPCGRGETALVWLRSHTIPLRLSMSPIKIYSCCQSSSRDDEFSFKKLRNLSVVTRLQVAFEIASRSLNAMLLLVLVECTRAAWTGMLGCDEHTEVLSDNIIFLLWTLFVISVIDTYLMSILLLPLSTRRTGKEVQQTSSRDTRLCLQQEKNQHIVAHTFRGLWRLYV